jgi:hypothetical protein
LFTRLLIEHFAGRLLQSCGKEQGERKTEKIFKERLEIGQSEKIKMSEKQLLKGGNFFKEVSFVFHSFSRHNGST